jgi:hypothetical protein
MMVGPIQSSPVFPRKPPSSSFSHTAIRDAYQAGLLMQDIGKVVGLTHQRVSNIIRRKP